MKKINWIAVLDQIFEGLGKTNPISLESKEFKFAVFTHENTRVGFMVVWEVSSRQAIRLSRLEVPEGMSSFKSRDEAIEYSSIYKLCFCIF